MRINLKSMLVGLASVLFVGSLAAPALAGGLNYATAWEDLLGARWNGYVQIKASYNDKGKHAKQGYHRFKRQAGPALDTGRLYTSAAKSRTDPAVRGRTDRVWDSPLWGDKYTTKYYYDFIYF